MRAFLRFLAAIAVAIALYFVGSLIWLDTSYPAYTYRYRLSISPEIDGQVRTASSVIEVTAQGGPFGGGDAKLRGQAPYLDLGERGTLVFSLGGDYDGSGRAARWIGAKAFGSDSSTPNIKKLPTLTGRRELPKDSIPVAFWFPKPGDPSVRRALLPQDFEAAFGSGARIASASVEITRDPVVLDIDKQLPWLGPLMAKPSAGDVYEYYPPADRVRVARFQLMRDEEGPSPLARMLVAGIVVGLTGLNRASCLTCIR